MGRNETLSKLKPKKSLPHHPYFTTQPINIIREYIKSFTKVNDVVLDPFCGSGTTAIAASIESRQAISYDLSPMAVFISKNSITKVDLEKAKDTFGKIKENISEKIIKTYTGEFTSTSAHHPEISLPKSSDAKNIKELFTERNLSNLTLLRDRILSEKDSSIRDFFLLVFSGMLHRASKTFFYDKANWGGGNSSIFTKFRYWIPSKPAERNVWELFEIRFNRMIKIKEKLQTQLKGKVEIKEGTATKLTKIESETIDYVYTDPPYGANIAYLDLSKMWIAWLNLNRKSRNEQEIIEGGSLGNSRTKYLELIGNAIKEIHRVLKPGKTLSLVFQHKDPKLWSSLIELCEKNGFEYINMFFYNSYYQTFHKNKNPLNLISGQLIINFKKNGKIKSHHRKSRKIEDVVDDITTNLEKNNETTTENIVTELIPKMFEAGIDPKSFDLMKHLKKTHSFDNEQKWRKNLTSKVSTMTNTKSRSVILDINLPSNTSENEAKEILKKLFDDSLNSLSDDGVLWTISTDIRNKKNFVPLGMMILDESIKRNLKNYNSVIWLQQKTAGNGFFSNFYSNIQMFTKNGDYFFDKDGVRESHIWKDVEWGKRKFRYNKKGKDPGNVWIKNIDDGKGKIIKQEFYSKNEIVERLFSLTAPTKSKKLLITNDNKIKDKSFQISRYEIPRLDSKDVFDYKKTPSKSKDTKRSIKIYFKSSEKMQQVKGNTIKLIITSPPYWNLKDYQKKEQIGFREEYETFNKRLEDVWKECFRILDVDGTLWINVNSRIQDGRVFHLNKDVYDIAKKIGFKLIDIVIWHKSSGIPVSGKRLKDNFEYVLVFAKNLPTLRIDTSKIFYDYKTTNNFTKCPNVWNLNRYTGSIGKKKFDHPAIFPDELVERTIKICTSEGQIVLDPFLGSGTTALVCADQNRKCISYELNKKFKDLIDYRMKHKIGEMPFFSANVTYIEN